MNRPRGCAEDIRDQFLVEALVLSLVGALTGMALGTAAAYAIGAIRSSGLRRGHR